MNRQPHSMSDQDINELNQDMHFWSLSPSEHLAKSPISQSSEVSLVSQSSTTISKAKFIESPLNLPLFELERGAQFSPFSSGLSHSSHLSDSKVEPSNFEMDKENIHPNLILNVEQYQIKANQSIEQSLVRLHKLREIKIDYQNALIQFNQQWHRKFIDAGFTKQDDFNVKFHEEEPKLESSKSFGRSYPSLSRMQTIHE